MEKSLSGYTKVKQFQNVQNNEKQIKQQNPVANALINQAIEGGTNAQNWKDIQPMRNYNDIKKKAFIQQKKRDYQQLKQTENEANAERKAMPFLQKKQKFENSDNIFPMIDLTSPQKDENQISVEEKDKVQFFKELQEKQQSMNAQQREQAKKKRIIEETKKELDQIQIMIGDQGIILLKAAIQQYKISSIKDILNNQNQNIEQIIIQLVDDLSLVFFHTYSNMPVNSMSIDMYDQKKNAIHKIAKYLQNSLEKNLFTKAFEEFFQQCENFHDQNVKEQMNKSVIDTLKSIGQKKFNCVQKLETTDLSIPLKQSEKQVVYINKLDKLEKDDLKCTVCFEAEDLQISKCGHILCKVCWQAWLARYLECPKCRQRLRPNQIRDFIIAKSIKE